MEDKRERRVKSFKCWMKPDKWSSFPDEMELFISKNGQVSSFDILPEEVDKLINCLIDYYKAHGPLCAPKDQEKK